ncbi:MAG: dTDP-4-dehydrorhamnose 3,5-epimerase [Candidatus Marinimicrobia bacterium]|nr:dTDP-4-dehydrorhamnose 3,5-epimerase [Candidatus Neomarinimicrobiota bacterium]
MKLSKTEFPGLMIVEPDVHGDDRGYFFESYRSEHFENAGLNLNFIQDNQSKSMRGVLRGLHYQLQNGQGKLVSCTFGEVFDVALDIRKGSPTFGKTFAMTLDDKDHHAIYIPPGFAHGFCVVSDEAIFQYKCTEKYDSDDEYGIRWNDESFRIEWPIDSPILSQRDQLLPLLAEQDVSLLPEYIT